MSPQSNAQYKAYSLATRTVPKTRQIVMLYDGALRFIKQAQIAVAEKRIEDRFRLLVRASDIMVGLQNSIDFENGGDVAHTLHRFYTNMSTRILSVNLHPTDSVKLCEEIYQDIREMRDVWDTIDRSGSSTSGTAAASEAATAMAGSAAPSTFSA